MSAKTVTISRRLPIALLLIVLVGSLTAYWSQQRIETHTRWATQIREARLLWEHMNQASALVRLAPSDQTRRIWMNDELDYAETAASNLGYIDQDHSTKLGMMYQAIQNLRGNLDPYLASLNSTGLDTLATILHSIANKFFAAYTNFVNYTSTETVTGPPFWYNGPAPPDETLLQQSIDLAVKMPGLPPVPPG